jgi:hypothetical protein
MKKTSSIERIFIEKDRKVMNKWKKVMNEKIERVMNKFKKSDE